MPPFYVIDSRGIEKNTGFFYCSVSIWEDKSSFNIGLPPDTKNDFLMTNIKRSGVRIAKVGNLYMTTSGIPVDPLLYIATPLNPNPLPAPNWQYENYSIDIVQVIKDNIETYIDRWLTLNSEIKGKRRNTISNILNLGGVDKYRIMTPEVSGLLGQGFIKRK